MPSTKLLGFLLTLGAAVLADDPARGAFTVTITGHGPVTYFQGQPQQSTLNFTGNTVSINPVVNTPLTMFTHFVGLSVGSYVGTFPQPDETYSVFTTYTVGSASVTVSQDARYREIANGQFMFSLTTSSPATLDLGADGRLTVTALGVSFQNQGGPASGGGQYLRTTFLLESPSAPQPTPEPATVTLFGIGLAGLGLARLRRRTG